MASHQGPDLSGLLYLALVGMWAILTALLWAVVWAANTVLPYYTGFALSVPEWAVACAIATVIMVWVSTKAL
jgi:hypothetical protein